MSEPLFQRVADLHLRVGADQALAEFLGDVLMHDEAARAGATLAGGADGAEDDGGYREFQIGGFVHDDGVVAAELQDRLAEARGHGFAHLAPDRCRAGEGNQCNARVVDETLRQGLPPSTNKENIAG